uniref:Uncharacterized protein n=1 Tax=Avena sativa TaxID=4498 RepID=A0ACD5TZI6_AVESA
MTTSPVCWSPEPQAAVLVSVDAAVFSDLQKMGVGIVVHDHNGVTSSQPISGLALPELAEAWALHREVSLVGDEGFSSAIFMTDCLSLFQRMNSSIFSRSEVGAVVLDIEGMMEPFSSEIVRHVKPAHILARS